MSESENDPESSNTPRSSPLEYAQPQAHKRFRRFPIVPCVIVLVVAGYFAISFIANVFFRPHAGPVNNRVISQMNLNQIGLAMLAYAHDHNHQLPDSMSTILANETITPGVFVNTGTSDYPARGPTTEALLTDFANPGHCSYLYVGNGLLDTDDPHTVVASEAPGTQHWSGMNVLFLNGHAEYFDPPKAQKLRAALAYGPVVMTGTGGWTRPTTQPTTRP